MQLVKNQRKPNSTNSLRSSADSLGSVSATRENKHQNSFALATPFKNVTRPQNSSQ